MARVIVSISLTEEEYAALEQARVTRDGIFARSEIVRQALVEYHASRASRES